MTIEELYARARNEGIDIDIVEMRELPAVSFPEGWIAIDRRKYPSDTAFKCDLAHEIGHCETGSFYNILTPFETRERCERKANKRAAEMLMPVEDVIRAIRQGFTTVELLAEFFDVTEQFAEMSLGIYDGLIIQAQERDQLEQMFAAHGITSEPRIKKGAGILPPMMKGSDLLAKAVKRNPRLNLTPHQLRVVMKAITELDKVGRKGV